MKTVKGIYSVRCVIRWPRRPDQKRKYLYEERITIWRAKNIDDAIEKAELEACRYMKGGSKKAAEGVQAYWLSDSLGNFRNGAELFSLFRESDLPPGKYLTHYFLSGNERSRSA
jgi:hypothetical protein